MIHILYKQVDHEICYGLSNEEFRCRCKQPFCKATIISDELVDAYVKFRRLIGNPLKINSGYRCAYHNKEVGGSTISRHTTGEAIDIALNGMGKMDSIDIEKLAKASGFTYVLFYPTFVHMDVR